MEEEKRRVVVAGCLEGALRLGKDRLRSGELREPPPLDNTPRLRPPIESPRSPLCLII